MRNRFEHGRKQRHFQKSGRGRRHFGHGLQAYLLVLLKEKPSYGYELMENLNKFGFESDQVDISTIYRNLRTMEDEYLVASDWSDSAQGPQKRMYTLTHDGEIALEKLIEKTIERKNRLETLIKQYETLV